MIDLKNKANLTWNRTPGFPFEGVQTTLFNSYMSVSWMQNTKTYETILKDRGDLTANETITGPDGPLTANEINANGGMMNTGLGMANGGAPTKKYYALLDYTPYIVAYDHMNLSKALLNEAKKLNGGAVTKTYNIIKKMGLPQVAKGGKTINLKAEPKNSTGLPAKAELNYNYNPPQ
jgi:hypothetical protein